jgi:hypothetical protein
VFSNEAVRPMESHPRSAAATRVDAAATSRDPIRARVAGRVTAARL